MSILAGRATASFKAVGDSIAGRIVSFEDYQETEYSDDPRKLGPTGVTGVKKGDPKFYPVKGKEDPRPVMAVRIVLDTTPGDEPTLVTLYAQGAKLQTAISAAFVEQKLGDIRVGDDLAVTFTGYEGKAKTYKAAYAKADVVAETEAPF
jgi:hypothetical protein